MRSSTLIGQFHDAVDVEHAGGKTEEEPDKRQHAVLLSDRDVPRVERVVEPVPHAKAENQRQNERHPNRAQLPDELPRRGRRRGHGSNILPLAPA